MRMKMLLFVIGLFIGCTCMLSAQNDENPIILEEYIVYEDGNAIVQQRDFYAYNENNLLIEHTLYERKYFYDEQENEIDSLALMWTREHTYLPNSDKILKKIEYRYSEQQKTISTTWDYTYYDNDCLKTVDLKYIDDDGTVDKMYTSYYNSSCAENNSYIDNPYSFQIARDSVIFYEDWGDGLQIFEKFVYEQEEFQKTWLKYHFYEDAYHLYSTIIEELDDDGNLLYYLSTETNSDHLHELFYTYDENNNLIQLDHYAKENLDSTKEYYGYSIYDFNEYNDLIYHKDYHRNHDLDTIIPYSETEYVYLYDEVGKIIENRRKVRYYENTGLPRDWKLYTRVYDTYCDGFHKRTNSYFNDELLSTRNFYYLKGTDCENENLPPLSLTAFPNPATEYVTFHSDVLLQAHSTVSLYDVTGKLIWQDKLSQRIDRYTLSTLSLAKGMYLVRIVSGEDVFSQKFLRE